MAWARIDDQYTDHPKIVTVGPLAAWLNTAGITYCSRYLTDGFIPAAVIPRLVNFTGIAVSTPEGWQPVDVTALVTALVTAMLWREVPGGYVIHDYLDYNPSAAEVKAERAKGAKRVAQWREKHKEMPGNGVSNGVTNGVSNGVRTPAPYPSPNDSSTNVDESQKGKRGRPGKEKNEAVDPLVERQKEIMAAYRAAVGYPLTTEPQENTAAKALARSTTYTPEQIVACYEAMKGEEFWTGKHLSLMSVAKNVGAFVAAGGKRSNGNGATKPYQQSTLQVLKGRESRQYVEPTADELAAAQAEWDAAPTGAQLRARAGVSQVPGHRVADA